MTNYLVLVALAIGLLLVLRSTRKAKHDARMKRLSCEVPRRAALPARRDLRRRDGTANRLQQHRP